MGVYNLASDWRGKTYAVKQVAPVVVEEDGRLAVVTVFFFYF
jgi:hypothetical protein